MKVCDLIPKEMTGFRFEIKPENLPAAFEVVQKSFDEFDDMSNLTEVFAYFGFSAEADRHGIGELDYCFTPERETTDLIDFIETIAPFVQSGSYIEMTGTEGGAWRWVFDGKEAIVQFPVDFIWPKQVMEENFFLSFYQSSRQDYWESTHQYNEYVDEVMFGIENIEGGVTSELFVRWYDIGGKLSPRFEMFVASIPEMELSLLTRVIQSALDYGDDLTPEDFCKCLQWLGFRDTSDEPLK